MDRSTATFLFAALALAFPAPLAKPSDDLGTMFKARLRALAGADSRDCGIVGVDKPSVKADKCAIEAFAQHKPFRVGYLGMNIDSLGAEGYAENKSQRIFHLSGWQSMIPGGGRAHIEVKECAKLHISDDGLTCEK